MSWITCNRLESTWRYWVLAEIDIIKARRETLLQLIDMHQNLHNQGLSTPWQESLPRGLCILVLLTVSF